METPELFLNPLNSWYHDLFWRMSARRQTGMNGPQPLQPSEVETWIRFLGVRLGPEERQLILDMDDQFLRVYQEESDAAAERKRVKAEAEAAASRRGAY